jgi:hypothetical protein
VSSGQVAYAQKRRSTRIDKAVPLAVQGLGAYREPYQEQVSTLSISCHGCAYQSKYEVIQGEVVYLDVRSSKDGSSHGASRAKVKWVQNLGAKGGFQVAVELEVAGNIWGIATPPEDWFPARVQIASDTSTSGRELHVVARTEQQSAGGLQVSPAPSSGGLQVAPAPDSGGFYASPEAFSIKVERTSLAPPNPESGQISPFVGNDALSSPLSSLSQLMAGLGEQIQVMASEAAKTALTEQKSRLLDEFRLQLREEAVKAMQSLMLASKADFTQLALKELTEANEAGARTNYANWTKKIEQDMESARQHMMIQAKEVNQSLDSMAAGTIERVQRSMETSRSEAVDRFVSRLRDQIAPMFAEAKETLQSLAASETLFKKESQTIYTELESQLETSANARLARVRNELDNNSAAVATRTNETLLKLSQDLEKAAREHLQFLLVSMGSQVTQTLEERTTEISREFSARLEGYTRSYLEFIGKSIAEIAKNSPGQSRE